MERVWYKTSDGRWHTTQYDATFVDQWCHDRGTDKDGWVLHHAAQHGRLANGQRVVAIHWEGE